MHNYKAKDHEIFAVLFGISGILYFLLQYSSSNFDKFRPYFWLFIILTAISGFIWGVWQIMISDSVFFTTLKWVIAIIAFLSPLLISICIVFNFFNFFLNYIQQLFIANIIISIYAIIFTTLFLIDVLYNRIIISFNTKKRSD